MGLVIAQQGLPTSIQGKLESIAYKIVSHEQDQAGAAAAVSKFHETVSHKWISRSDHDFTKNMLQSRVLREIQEIMLKHNMLQHAT